MVREDVLVPNWTAANTMDLTPTFGVRFTGRGADLVVPKLTVGQDEEDELIPTITPTGPGAFWDGTITLESWVSPEDTLDSGGAELGFALAKKLARDIIEEALRLVRASGQTLTGIELIKPVGRRYSPDVSASPVLERWILVCRYLWDERPA